MSQFWNIALSIAFLLQVSILDWFFSPISNICVPPHIFGNLKKPLKNEIAPFTLYFSQSRCWIFCWLCRVVYIVHNQPAHVLLLLINQLTVTVYFGKWSWIVMIVLAKFDIFLGSKITVIATFGSYKGTRNVIDKNKSKKHALWRQLRSEIRTQLFL